jgi:hypothetical protein
MKSGEILAKMDYHQNQLGELHLGPSSKQDDKKVNYSSALCYSEKTFLIRILSEKQTAAELFMIMNHFGIFFKYLADVCFSDKRLCIPFETILNRKKTPFCTQIPIRITIIFSILEFLIFANLKFS